MVICVQLHTQMHRAIRQAKCWLDWPNGAVWARTDSVSSTARRSPVQALAAGTRRGRASWTFGAPSFPFQLLHGFLEGRDLIGPESTPEVILEHVGLPEYSVAVKLVHEPGPPPRLGSQ